LRKKPKWKRLKLLLSGIFYLPINFLAAFFLYPMKTSTWLATQIYYVEPWEQLLVKALKPYADVAIQMGIAEQYYFMRYWHRGSHIRLWIKGETEMLDAILKPNIIEHFDNYFEARPSDRTENVEDWLPNNSVCFIVTQPETARFCGSTGLAIAESQFQASSDVVLKFLKEKEFRWSYDDALGAAVKLHLSFVHALGMDIMTAQTFFEQIYYNWLPAAFPVNPNSLSEKEFDKLARDTSVIFLEGFDTQRARIVPFCVALWDTLENNDFSSDDAMIAWINTNKLVHHQLVMALEFGNLEPRPKNLLLNTSVTLSDDELLLWSLYANFIHLTNNRLGINTKDEGYLGYLIMRSIEAMRTIV
jgi:thiopeptide-type bacteriocin biosynthesis protein